MLMDSLFLRNTVVRRLLAVGLCVVLVVSMRDRLFPTIRPAAGTSVASISTVGGKVETGEATRKVHFLLPATHTNALFCKTLFSAVLNGYPSPTILNFDKKFETAEEARFMKLAATYTYLDTKVGDDDLVMLFDSYDTWFQLPFEDLISRYYRMQEADLDRHLRAGKEAAAWQEVVIFAADKSCWPNDPKSNACTKVPQSTLPEKIYGPDTDHDERDYKVRPRWLNSGNIIGPGKVFKQIYLRAYGIQQKSKARFSDQLILSDIYGEQDLPISLDYESYLFQTMTHSHNDVVYLMEEQREAPTAADEADLAKEPELVSRAFFRSPVPRYNSDRHMGWNRVSGYCPAVMHFNGNKDPLTTWWGQMWYIHNEDPQTRLRNIKTVRRLGGAFLEDGSFVDWSHMCSKYDVYDAVPMPGAAGKVKMDESPSIDPVAYRLGVDPRKQPGDTIDELKAAGL
ncbi:uncharacterized protein V1510DRAFT_420414 [Dipodascopsis tothii]|uniref:uncharacterized protein n=1 Tax=Dipodascopsis tothii TaxID=44089 RepID=UPI0034CEE0AC